jgi:hypothetical protein
MSGNSYAFYRTSDHGWAHWMQMQAYARGGYPDGFLGANLWQLPLKDAAPPWRNALVSSGQAHGAGMSRLQGLYTSADLTRRI